MRQWDGENRLSPYRRPSSPLRPFRWQRNLIRRRAKRPERAISFSRRPSFCNKLAALAPPLVPTAPPFPRRRGHNKVPLNISFISCSNVSTDCSVTACGGGKGTGVTPANWIRRGAKRPENQVNPSQRRGGAAGKAQMILHRYSDRQTAACSPHSKNASLWGGVFDWSDLRNGWRGITVYHFHRKLFTNSFPSDLKLWCITSIGNLLQIVSRPA